MIHKPLLTGSIAALIVALLDQASKWWVLELFDKPPYLIKITGFFNLVLGWNRGISFGLFGSDSEIGKWVLTALAIAICCILAVWLRKASRMIEILAYGMIIGGALGNVLDRIRYGAVTDFLDFHIAGTHWPAFNVADSAIFVGAVLLVTDSLFNSDKHA